MRTLNKYIHFINNENELGHNAKKAGQGCQTLPVRAQGKAASGYWSIMTILVTVVTRYVTRLSMAKLRLSEFVAQLNSFVMGGRIFL